MALEDVKLQEANERLQAVRQKAEVEAKAAQETLEGAREQRRLRNAVLSMDLHQRHGRILSEADMVSIQDLARTATCLRSAEASSSLGAALCLETFLVNDKGFPRSLAVRLRSSFGRAVRKQWDLAYGDGCAPPPKKHIFVNGQEQEANCYYETHKGIVEEAFKQWRHRDAAAAAATSTARPGGPLSRISDFFARQGGCSASARPAVDAEDDDTSSEA